MPVFFNDRDGQTLLSKKECLGLKLDHISTIKELDEAEQMNITRGLLWLESQKEKNCISERFFKRLHKKLFGEVWCWAGEYRLSEKNIGVDYWQIPFEMKKFVEDVNYWLERSVYSDWAEFLAHFHHRLVSIHPFPNGNGRFSRILTNCISIQGKQLQPHWHEHLPAQKRRLLYIQALRSADEKKYSELIDFFKNP